MALPSPQAPLQGNWPATRPVKRANKATPNPPECWSTPIPRQCPPAEISLCFQLLLGSEGCRLPHEAQAMALLPAVDKTRYGGFFPKPRLAANYPAKCPPREKSVKDTKQPARCPTLNLKVKRGVSPYYVNSKVEKETCTSKLPILGHHRPKHVLTCKKINPLLFQQPPPAFS